MSADASKLTSTELQVLAQVWREQHDLLAQSEALKEFNERLQREWAIETGIIEQIYTLDRGVTQLLIEHGIDASLIRNDSTNKDPDMVAAMIRDHEEAIENLFDFVTGQRQLSTSYIKELHALMTRHQETTSAVNTLGRQVEVPLLRGAYKELPNNPVRHDGSIHEYCPPEHVPAEMDRLIALHLEHESGKVPVDVEAAWFHHRFSQIHPFQDGNGRVARALATLIFIRAGWFPLVITRDDRERYISALEQADEADLSALLKLFAGAERRAFVKALGVAGEVLRQERVDQVIDAARELLEKRRETLRKHWENAKVQAERLQHVAADVLYRVAERLGKELGHLLADHRFSLDEEAYGGDRDYYFRSQIIETAKDLGYFANPNIYRSWIRLVIRADAQTEVLVSFHGIGREFRGVVAASMCYFRREQTERGERQVTDRVTVCDDVFQVNYLDEPDDVKGRFTDWLNTGLVKALDLWRQSL